MKKQELDAHLQLLILHNSRTPKTIITRSVYQPRECFSFPTLMIYLETTKYSVLYRPHTRAPQVSKRRTHVCTYILSAFASLPCRVSYYMYDRTIPPRFTGVNHAPPYRVGPIKGGGERGREGGRERGGEKGFQN